MAEEVFPEPENDNEETNARTKEEKESRALKIIQQQVALLMDELKRSTPVSGAKTNQQSTRSDEALIR